MSLSSAGRPRAADPSSGQSRAGLSACPLRRGELLFSPQTTPMPPCRTPVAAPGPPRGGTLPRPARPPPPTERTRPGLRPQPTPPPQPPTRRRPETGGRRGSAGAVAVQPVTAEDPAARRGRRPRSAPTPTHTAASRRAPSPQTRSPASRHPPGRSPPAHHRQATADSGQDRRQPQQPKQRPATPTGSRSNRGLGRSRDDEGGAPR